MKNQSIGILDSGIGGLSIYQELVLQLPYESIVYIGDYKNAPYSLLTEKKIYDYATMLIRFLISYDVKAIVLACNTITVTCIDKLRDTFPSVPIIGTVPVIKTAAMVSRNKHIGVLSTTRTASSIYQKDLIQKFANTCQVQNIGTDALAPRIERGEAQGAYFEKIVNEVIQPFVHNKTDTIALGCTHYPFIKYQLQKALGNNVLLLDSSGAVARHVRRVLGNNQRLEEKRKPSYAFFTTGEKEQFDHIAKRLLGATIASTHVHL